MNRPIALIWAEGFLDRIAAQKLAAAVGVRIEGPIKDAGGESAFWRALPKYNQAARTLGLVLALADHDDHQSCVGPKLARLVRNRHPNLILRLSVTQLESWFLADPASLASHLSVPAGAFPREPDKEPEPKRALVQIAARSTRPSIRFGMTPSSGVSASTGKEYTLIMESFITERWEPLRAADRSPSLRRAIAAIRSMARVRPD